MHVAVVLNEKVNLSGDWVVDINEGMIDCHARHGATSSMSLNSSRSHSKSAKFER